MADDDTDTLDDTEDAQADTTSPPPWPPQRPDQPQFPAQPPLASLAPGAPATPPSPFIPTPPANVPPNQFQQQQQQQQRPKPVPTPAPQQAPMEAPPGWPARLPPPFRPPYRPPTSRPRDQWGDDSWDVVGAFNTPGNDLGPNLPSVPEANQILLGLGPMSQFLSKYVGEPAARTAFFSQEVMKFAPLIDLATKGQFSRAFLAAQMGNMKLAEEQQKFHAAETMDRWQRQLYAFKQIIGEYEHHAMTKPEFEDQLRALAAQTGHDNLMNTYANEGATGVYNLLDWEDQQFRKSYASYATKKKSSGGTAADGGYDPYDPNQSGSAGAGRDEATKSGLPNIDPSTGQPAAQSTSQIQTPAVSTDPTEYNNYLKKHYDINDKAVKDATDAALGRDVELLKDKKNDRYRNVNAASTDVSNRLKQIAGSDMSIEDRNKALEAYDNALPSELKALSQYDQDPDKIPSKNNQRETKENLARLMYPGYKPGFFSLAQKYKTPGAPQGRNITRYNGAPQAVMGVWAATIPIGESEVIPKHVFDDFIAGHYSGEAKWRTLQAAMNDAAVIISGVQSGTGAARVALVHMMMGDTTRDSSGAQIRTAFQNNLRNTVVEAATTNLEWEKETGDPRALVPFLREDAVRNADALMRANAINGMVPSDSPDAVLAVGKTGKDIPSGYKKDDPALRPPPTNADIKFMQQVIRENRDSKDPVMQQRIRNYHQMIGINPKQSLLPLLDPDVEPVH